MAEESPAALGGTWRGKKSGPTADASPLSGGGQAQSHPTSVPPGKNYRLYRKIARATKATVIIHRMTSLLPFFSSAIGGVQHTRNQRRKYRDFRRHFTVLMRRWLCPSACSR